MQAERLPNGKIRLEGRIWSDEFSEDRLEAWIKWYDQMYAEKGREGYKDAADALRAVL